MDLKPLLSNFFTLDPRKIDWQRTAILVLCVLVAFFWLKARLMPQIREVTSTEFRRVPQIHEVEKIKRVTVPGPERIVVLDKAEVVRKLPAVSPQVAGDDGQQITATASAPESRNGYEAIAVIDTKTGETRIEAREKAPPHFKFQNHGYLQMWGGINHKGETPIQAEAAWFPVRIKNSRWGIKGDLNTDGNARAMVGGGWEW